MATTAQMQGNESRASLVAAGWAKLPASYRMPARTPTLDEAKAWCKQLATSHYENFHVASWLLPESLRPHFHSIYAYCRVSDDLGDEVGDRDQSLALLEDWGRQLDACYEGKATHPVFVALSDTIQACRIPKEPFADLLVAFRQDQSVTRYADMGELLNYCRYSANPVGRLVLYACGYRDAERFQLSDATCEALQLVNFWQDVTLDWKKDRVYIPQDRLARHGVSEADIAAARMTPGYARMMQELVAETRALFAQGLPLIGMVDRELAVDLDLFSRGGMAIADAIQRAGYDTLSARPRLGKVAKLGLALRALGGKVLPALTLGGASKRPAA